MRHTQPPVEPEPDDEERRRGSVWEWTFDAAGTAIEITLELLGAIVGGIIRVVAGLAALVLDSCG